MIRRSLIALVALLADVALPPLPAFAQAPGYSLPSAIASVGLSQAQWDVICRQARTQAHRVGVAEAALLSAAESAGIRLAGAGRSNALSLQQAILEELSRQADQIGDLQRQLDSMENGADQDSSAIIAQSRTALASGRLGEADALLAQVSERDMSALRQADVDAGRRRLRVGTILMSRGELAHIQANYQLAADFYERAAATVPQSAIAERWRYTHLAAVALTAQGERFVEPRQLHEAIRTFRAALALAQQPRRRVESDAALAYAGVRLADLGDESALTIANDAITEARSTQLADISLRLPAELNATAARLAIHEYRQGDRSALTRSIRAYEEAIQGLQNSTTIELSARVTIGLAEAYLTWGDEAQLSGPIDAAITQMHQLIDSNQNELSDESFAYANMLLGVAYLGKMRRAGYTSVETAFLSQRAATAFTAAEQIFSRTPGTIYEVALQNNIGQFFDFQCQYEMVWRQRPLPYCQEALRRYQSARTSLMEDSALTRTLDENIDRMRSLISQISDPPGDAPSHEPRR